MLCRFSTCFRAVVTALAAARDVHMVEIRGQPANRGMTIVAVRATRDMRRVLAGGRDTVMTGATGTNHLHVVDTNRRRPSRLAMTVLADVCRLDVRRALAGRVCTVVTTGTVTEDAGVVENRRGPCGAAMTVIALIVRGHVRRGFASRLYAVMAAHTTARKGCVIHEGNNVPVRRYVTVRAFARCDDMISGLRRGTYEAALRVTTRAGLCSRPECCADMAPVTADIEMRAVELETGAEVIEVLLCINGRNRKVRNDERYQ